MAVHVESVNDLAKTNDGVAVLLNRYTDWKCRSGVTEAPLIPASIMSKITDYARTTAKGNSVALNYTHVILSLAPTIGVAIPGHVTVELVNPNVDGPFQVMNGQTLSWSPGAGKPCLMIFSVHHQLNSDHEPFRVRITNSGIPTKKSYARCHAYWGYDVGTRHRYYKSEPARLIELEVGYQRTLLSSIKAVEAYVQFTFDTSRMESNPQLCTKSKVNIVPPKAETFPIRGIAPPLSVGKNQGQQSEVSKQQGGNGNESIKLSSSGPTLRPGSALSMKRGSRRNIAYTSNPIKRNQDGNWLGDHLSNKGRDIRPKAGETLDEPVKLDA
uniref:SC38P2 n=1 Tax=Sweet clover necrotic mosaic virus TaxID=28348 RepID=Q90058_9TOMB|nr:SC38P2 [Sweet clover necrotic mosaic virus]